MIPKFTKYEEGVLTIWPWCFIYNTNLKLLHQVSSFLEVHKDTRILQTVCILVLHLMYGYNNSEQFWACWLYF